MGGRGGGGGILPACAENQLVFPDLFDAGRPLRAIDRADAERVADPATKDVPDVIEPPIVFFRSDTLWPALRKAAGSCGLGLFGWKRKQTHSCRSGPQSAMPLQAQRRLPIKDGWHCFAFLCV